ncbi:MAG: hypothetical protein EP305_11750 [Bacteroidetes bacterium]|nr:MAG: hypothetical protein EP305_11750 [Bacteroidota bacterium]
MFNSDRNVLLLSILVAFLIFGGILEGYFFLEQIELTPQNWIWMIVIRLCFHTMGILPLWLLMGYLWRSAWKAVVLGLINLALMNVYPICDLVYGPIVIDHPKPETWVREEYNNLSSEYDFTTHEVPMIRLEQGKRSILMTDDRWNAIVARCGGQIPNRFVGLEYLELELENECGVQK